MLKRTLFHRGGEINPTGEIDPTGPRRPAPELERAARERLRAWAGRGRRAGGVVTRWRQRWRLAQAAGGDLLKRALDAAAAVGLLLALGPLFAAVALAIRLGDGGPALYWQLRVGRGGRRFWMPKFRSMVVGAEAARRQLEAANHHTEGVTFKIKHDPRVTRLGRYLRKFSVDELPQLWCVLRGDMSLVGPRPPLPAEVEKYTLADRRRLEITPGLTCLWQVGGRADLPFALQRELDVQYIDTRGLWLDLWLLIRTIPAVLSARGAY